MMTFEKTKASMEITPLTQYPSTSYNKSDYFQYFFKIFLKETKWHR